MPLPEQNGPNGPTSKQAATLSLLQTLASSGNQLVQFGTLALVAISGLTSFFQGREISKEGHHERERAIKEIHALYDKIDDTERRQAHALNDLANLLESNSKQVRNQIEMLDNQQKLLDLVRRTQKQYLRKNGIDLDAAPNHFEPGE